jgi:1-acyl-sn-glycerol-3-phosphate acyltransferase
MNFLKSLLHFLLMVISLIPWATYILLASLVLDKNKLYELGVMWLRFVIASAKFILGIQVIAQHHSQLNIENNRKIIYLAKHQSALETLLLPTLLPTYAAYVFKRELLAIPFFGWVLSRLDMIHIDRSKRSEAFQKVSNQGSQILANGTSIIIFPEGTRIPRGQKGTYKLGGARLAVATGADVIPVAITSAKCWPRHAFIKTAGVVDVSFGPIVSTLGKSPEALMAEVENWIESEMRRLDPTAYVDQP